MTDTLESISSILAGAPGAVDPRFKVDTQTLLGQRCLRSRTAFAAGETLIPFRTTGVHARPSRMTVQVSEHDHIDLAPAFLQLVNHGCDPNVYFDVERRALTALLPIAPGDELLFFYPSTEWVMASPFDCRCGSSRCIVHVAGASELPASVLGRTSSRRTSTGCSRSARDAGA